MHNGPHEMQYMRHVMDISLGIFANGPSQAARAVPLVNNSSACACFAQPGAPNPVPPSNPLRWGSALGEGRQPYTGRLFLKFFKK